MYAKEPMLASKLDLKRKAFKATKGRKGGDVEGFREFCGE